MKTEDKIQFNVIVILQLNNLLIINQYLITNLYIIYMQNSRKINIKIQGEQKPFEAEISTNDTFITLKNKLYLTHQKIADLYPFINGRIQVKPTSSRIFDIIQANPQFVYLLFGSLNIIISQSIKSKSLGLSDQTFKSNTAKSFVNATLDQIKNLKLQQKIQKINVPQQGKSQLKSVRITDLSHQQLINLFNILKVENGRYLDQKMQIMTSNKVSITYQIKQNDYKDMIQDKGISHFFHNQNITQQTKQVCQQGFKDKQLKNKVPYIFAFSFSQEQDYVKLQKGIQKMDCTFVQHCFPRGQVNFVSVQAKPCEQMINYFQNQDLISFQQILQFYRKYGQFVIKKFTIGLKRVCSQKIIQTLQAKSTQQIEKLSTMAAGRIRQYMLQSSTQLSKGTKNANLQIKSDQVVHYDIKAIGGAIQYCQNITLWKQSVNNWQLWRIIAVNQVQRIQKYLPTNIQQKIQIILNQQISKINQILTTKKIQPQSLLSNKIHQTKQKLQIQSNFEIIATFKQKIYQILTLDQNYLILIFLDKIVKFNNIKMTNDFTIEYRQPSKCFYQRQPGYMTACIYQYSVFIATQAGIIKINFFDNTLKVIVTGNWRESTILLPYKNKLYTNGWRGIYEIDPNSGEYFVKIGGDWRFYTATRIKNNVYLFYWNIYCLDLDSMIYSKINFGFWNQFWGDYTYPTNDGVRLWHLYRNTLYCFDGNKFSSVEFSKKGIAIDSFTSRSICYKKGFLYLSNFDQNQHLMKIPV